MNTEKFFASPSVAALASRLGVELTDVARTTGRTRIAHEDVEQHAQSGESSAGVLKTTESDNRFWDVDHSVFGSVEHEPLSSFARIASENLSASNRIIPQVTHHDRADMRAVDAFRTSLKAKATARGIRLTALAFHVKALSICLSEYPRFNASLTADGKTLVLKRCCHIGIAVDTPHRFHGAGRP